MKNLRVALVALLIGITIFSTYKYISSIRERYDLAHNLDRVKAEAAVLEEEKQNLLQTIEKDKELQVQLSQENAELKDYLKASRKRLAKLFIGVRETRKAVEQLSSQYTAAKAENTVLLEQNSKVTQENETLKARMSSLDELKKAIKELKTKIRNVGVGIKNKFRKAERKEIIEGNRGFVIKDGKPTQAAKVRIEVMPALDK